MFSKITDFIKPSAPATDKVPSETIQKVRPLGEEDTPRDQRRNPREESEATPRFSEGDEAVVSLNAIEAYLTGRLNQQPEAAGTRPENDTVNQTHRSAVDAYGRNTPPASPPEETPMTAAEEDRTINNLLAQVHRLKRQGIDRIPLSVGQSFEEALDTAVRSMGT